MPEQITSEAIDESTTDEAASLTREQRAAARETARAAGVRAVREAARRQRSTITASLTANYSPNAGEDGRYATVLNALVVAGILTTTEDGSYVPADGFEPTSEGVGVLSDKERDCLVHMAHGAGYVLTAERLNLSVGTIKSRVQIIYSERFGVHSLPEAVIAAVRIGALPLSAVLS